MARRRAHGAATNGMLPSLRASGQRGRCGSTGQIRVRRAFRRLLFGIVATAEGLPGLSSVTATPGVQEKYLPVAADDTAGRTGVQGAAPGADGLFTRFALDLAAQRPGRPVAVLQAGCTTAGPELDLDLLRAFGHDLDVSLIDD